MPLHSTSILIKHLLRRQVSRACDEWKTGIFRSSSTLVSSRVGHPTNIDLVDVNQLFPNIHGTVSRVFHLWKIGFFANNRNSLLKEVGRRYYHIIRDQVYVLKLSNRLFFHPTHGAWLPLAHKISRGAWLPFVALRIPRCTWLPLAQRILQSRCFWISTLVVAYGTFYTYNMETIPYSKRIHFVPFSRKFERWVGEEEFIELKAEHKRHILAATHPTSKRVTLIAENIIKALHRDLRDDKFWRRPNYASHAIHYLDHMADWEVIVIDYPITNAFCYPGGKIVVYTSLLDYYNLKSDGEIAALIGHEIAHAVARHMTETVGGLMKYAVFKSCIDQKLELEADYIGFLLMASAGYNPRDGLKMWEKFAKHEARHRDYYESIIRRTHPPATKRVECVAQALEEAINLYNESRSRASQGKMQ